MKWFILVLMIGTHSDGSRDTFVYLEPEFNSVEQCQRYVYHQAPEIRNHMMIEYEGKSIETVYCVRENKLKEILQPPGTNA